MKRRVSFGQCRTHPTANVGAMRNRRRLVRLRRCDSATVGRKEGERPRRESSRCFRPRSRSFPLCVHLVYTDRPARVLWG